jgi:hypothetical protein
MLEKKILYFIFIKSGNLLLFSKNFLQISSTQIFILSLHDLQDLIPKFFWSYLLTATGFPKNQGRGWQIIFYG